MAWGEYNAARGQGTNVLCLGQPNMGPVGTAPSQSPRRRPSREREGEYVDAAPLTVYRRYGPRSIARSLFSGEIRSIRYRDDIAREECAAERFAVVGDSFRRGLVAPPSASRAPRSTPRPRGRAHSSPGAAARQTPRRLCRCGRGGVRAWDRLRGSRRSSVVSRQKKMCRPQPVEGQLHAHTRHSALGTSL
jgi:hypothetical protein